MSATGSHLKVRRMGSEVMGVELLGDRRKPEPESFRVMFPGGDVDVVRCSDDSYWIHVRINRADDLHGDPDRTMARLADGRLDVLGKPASECDAGDFANPRLYHLAVRVEVAK